MALSPNKIRNKIHNLITVTVVLIVLGAVLLGLARSNVFEADAVTTFAPSTDFTEKTCTVIEVEHKEATVDTEYDGDAWESLIPPCGSFTGICVGKGCNDIYRYKFVVDGSTASDVDVAVHAQQKATAEAIIQKNQDTLAEETESQLLFCDATNASGVYDPGDCDFANQYVDKAENDLSRSQAALASIPNQAQPDAFWSSEETIERTPIFSCNIAVTGPADYKLGVGVGNTTSCWVPTVAVSALNSAYDCSMNTACIRLISDPNGDVAPEPSKALEATAKVLEIIGIILIPVGLLFPCIALLCCIVKKPIRMRQNPPGAQLASQDGGLGRWGFGA